MAFKTVKTYNEEKFGDFFLLRNDGDSADVIFLYRNIDDVLVADTHYIKSPDYSGYAHCCGKGCPACGKGIRVQNKLFIPLYNLNENAIQFWDRTMRFENQLNQDVFSRYPNPSEFVFTITRHGAAGDVNTTYEITARAKNNYKSFSEILAENKATFPDYYNHICKELSIDKMRTMLNNSNSSSNVDSNDMPAYEPTPRSTYVPTQNTFNEPPTDISDDIDIGDEIEENVDF